MKLVFLLIISPVLLILAALVKNDALSTEPPGLKKRLALAFTTNIAQTADDHAFAELRTPAYDMDRDALWQRLQYAGESLGWQLESADPVAGRMHWVITTPLLRFRDDVTVDIRSEYPAGDSGRQLLDIRSQSRKGTGDLGQNRAHVQRLLKELDGAS